MEFFIIVTAVIIAALFSNNVNEKNATKKKQQTLIPPIFEQKKGICCFCGEKTGVFETYHKGCLNVYLDGKAKLSELSANLLSDEMDIPFVLQKNEKVIWCFKEVTQLKYKNKTVYQGSSAGYSFKVAKGFYIRQSFFKGHPVHYTSLEHEDSGCIVLTDKNLYFCGQYNIFRLPYDRILAINPYYATVVIQKDTTTAKPIIFEIDDVWFFYNLIYNLIHMEF